MQTTNQKAHPFEMSSMGVGPYSFRGMVSMPSPSLQEQNPDAYRMAMHDFMEAMRGVEWDGVCRHCNTPIRNVCIVADASGKRYGVGCDCVGKTGDKSLGDSLKVAQAIHNRNLRRARNEANREAKRQLWLKQICHTGETNAERLERERAESVAKHAAMVARTEARVKSLAEVISILEATQGDFCASMVRQLKETGYVSDRCNQIIVDICAKTYGRRNSEAYDDASTKFRELMEQPAN